MTWLASARWSELVLWQPFLYEQYKLELDLPLQHYYPAFHREDVTLRQLLTHTSGLDPFIPNRDQLTAPELKEALNH